jgi:hypothetical protein
MYVIDHTKSVGENLGVTPEPPKRDATNWLKAVWSTGIGRIALIGGGGLLVLRLMKKKKSRK